VSCPIVQPELRSAPRGTEVPDEEVQIAVTIDISCRYRMRIIELLWEIGGGVNKPPVGSRERKLVLKAWKGRHVLSVIRDKNIRPPITVEVCDHHLPGMLHYRRRADEDGCGGVKVVSSAIVSENRQRMNRVRLKYTTGQNHIEEAIPCEVRCCYNENAACSTGFELQYKLARSEDR
jgi:hypothetical protein